MNKNLFRSKGINIIGLLILIMLAGEFEHCVYADENIVPNNIIEIDEGNNKIIKRKYRDKFIEIGDDDNSFIKIIENEKIAINTRDNYIFVGYAVDDIYYIKSKKEFIYKPLRFLLAVQGNELKLFYTGIDGKIRDVSEYAEKKFERYNVHFEGFEEENIYLISTRGVNNFELRNLKEVNGVMTYLKLKN